ncbi:MAG: type II toxin-antitoxin system RelE/ParE family toxin [Terriglobales bacterium]
MPVEIVWSPVARRRLQEIRDYTAKDKPVAAEKLAIRIVAAVQALRKYPHLGRAGADPDIRELVIGKTPYIVLYKVHGSKITINIVWHGAQRRES